MNAQIPPQVHIAMQEIAGQISPTDDLETRLKSAMEKVRDHWMATEDDHQFRAAVGAVLLSYPPESDEFKRIQYEMRQLQRMQTIIQAAQLGMSVGRFDVPDDAPEVIGLLGMWRNNQ